MDERSGVEEVLFAIEAGTLGDPVSLVAYLAGRRLALDEAELAGTRRRTLFLLASGGDPRRELSLDDPAVKLLARELHSHERVCELARGLDELAPQARDLPAVRDVIVRLADDPDLAWRALSLALLAEWLGLAGEE